MNVFFDMDYTIIETDNGTLRPGVVELFQRLVTDGHSIYIWSGMGARTEEVIALGLHEMVEGVFRKPWEKYEETVWEMLNTDEIPVRPDLVVDDTAAIVRVFGGIVVRHYGSLSPPSDREMDHVYRVICEFSNHGTSVDPRFVLPPASSIAKHSK